MGGRGGEATGGTTGTGGAATGGGTGGTGTGGAGGSSAGMSTGCGKAPTIPSSDYNNGHHIAITVGNMAREYILNVPTNYDNSHPYKLIIAYHELNGNDDEMYRNQYYHLLPLANNTAIFVAPNGQQNNANCTQAGGCGWPNPNNTDLAFADALVAQIEQTLLRRYGSDLRHRLELWRQHVVQDRVRETAWRRRKRIHSRDRCLFGLSAEWQLYAHETGRLLCVARDR